MKASNLLNLTSLIDGLSELGPVKKHLLRAGREVLLAVEGFLGFADQYVSAGQSQGERQQVVRNAIVYAKRTVRMIARQLPRVDEEEYRVLHRKVLGSILEVLDKEIRKTSRLANPKSKMKLDVLQAIRNVLLREVYEPETEGDSYDHTA